MALETIDGMLLIVHVPIVVPSFTPTVTVYSQETSSLLALNHLIIGGISLLMYSAILDLTNSTVSVLLLSIVFSYP